MTRTPRMFLTAATLLLAGAALLLSAACDRDSSEPPAPTATAAASVTASAEPTPDPTDEALAISLSRLAALTLAPADVPPGYEARASLPVARREAAVANVAIKPLATFLNLSDLEGAWVSFFVRTQPETSLSSRVFSFAKPESATRLVETIAALSVADYPAATAVERVQADDIGGTSQMMRFRVPGSRMLEYTWTQGRYAGQVVLRYAGDIESTEDVGLIVSLARIQAAKMQAAPP